MKNMNQRVATRPPKDNLISLLCSGLGSGKMREHCCRLQRVKCFEMGSGLFKECSVEPKF